jgi:outer membrane biosynthesis protein TonB
LFGADWPDVAGAERIEARTTAPGHLKYPRGLESQRAVVVVAVLVGADGTPLRAESLCATATGFDMAAKRLAMSAEYAPARVDGVAVTQPYSVVVKFSGVRSRGQRGAATD